MYFCEIRIIHYHLKPGFTFRNHECIYPDITYPDAVFRPSPASDVYVWVSQRFPIPRNGILKLSSMESSSLACARIRTLHEDVDKSKQTQISPSVCINGLPYHEIESSSLACARIRTLHKDADKSMQPISAHRFSPQSAPKPASGAFSMQMRGVGLKNGIPYLQMGLSTLASHVSRRLEDQRTSINQSIPRRFFF